MPCSFAVCGVALRTEHAETKPVWVYRSPALGLHALGLFDTFCRITSVVRHHKFDRTWFAALQALSKSCGRTAWSQSVAASLAALVWSHSFVALVCGTVARAWCRRRNPAIILYSACNLYITQAFLDCG